MDAWALAESIVLASQERVVLSARLEPVSSVRLSIRYGGVRIDQRYFVQNPATKAFDRPVTGSRASRPYVICSRVAPSVEANALVESLAQSAHYYGVLVL